MIKSPALGLLMYSFLENFKDRLIDYCMDFKYLVDEQRLEKLKGNTLNFINNELEGRVKDKTDHKYDEIKIRLTTLVNSQVKNANGSKNIYEKFQNLIWPYFFVRIKEDGNDQIATWFPDYQTSDRIQKINLYPTHYLESRGDYNSDKDNKQLLKYIGQGGIDAGTIQSIILGSMRNYAGIKSFQNKIYNNLFLRDDIDSINIDLFTGNFSLLQSVINIKKSRSDNNVQGLIALCSPLIGFFNPEGKQDIDIIIDEYVPNIGKNSSYVIRSMDMNNEPIYSYLNKAFKEVFGNEYLEVFYKELEYVVREINRGVLSNIDNIQLKIYHDIKNQLNNSIVNPLNKIIENDRSGSNKIISNMLKSVTNYVTNLDNLLRGYADLYKNEDQVNFYTISSNSQRSIDNYFKTKIEGDSPKIDVINKGVAGQLNISEDSFETILYLIVTNAIDAMVSRGIEVNEQTIKINFKPIDRKGLKYCQTSIWNSGTTFYKEILQYGWNRAFTIINQPNRSGMGLYIVNTFLKLANAYKYSDKNFIKLENVESGAKISFRTLLIGGDE